MDTVSIKEARNKFATLINAAQCGRTVAITRRGMLVAKMVSPTPLRQRGLPDRATFRKVIKIRGTSLSKTVIALRRQEPY